MVLEACGNQRTRDCCGVVVVPEGGDGISVGALVAGVLLGGLEAPENLVLWRGR